jgi:hypothetical protein
MFIEERDRIKRRSLLGIKPKHSPPHCLCRIVFLHISQHAQAPAMPAPDKDPAFNLYGKVELRVGKVKAPFSGMVETMLCHPFWVYAPQRIE